jgi:hypothetical protein
MNKKMSLALIGVVAVSLAVVFATAGSLMADTPLYIFRMEQHSSKMNFSPAAVNGFTYDTEEGYTMNYTVTNYSGAALLGTDATCFPTCQGWTCDATGCQNTCNDTCPDTCSSTCPSTCSFTCSTCEGNGWTCDATGCQATCPGASCGGTCSNTCGHTCAGETMCEPHPP